MQEVQATAKGNAGTHGHCQAAWVLARAGGKCQAAWGLGPAGGCSEPGPNPAGHPLAPAVLPPPPQHIQFPQVGPGWPESTRTTWGPREPLMEPGPRVPFAPKCEGTWWSSFQAEERLPGARAR